MNDINLEKMLYIVVISIFTVVIICPILVSTCSYECTEAELFVKLVVFMIIIVIVSVILYFIFILPKLQKAAEDQFNSFMANNKFHISKHINIERTEVDRLDFVVDDINKQFAIYSAKKEKIIKI